MGVQSWVKNVKSIGLSTQPCRGGVVFSSDMLLSVSEEVHDPCTQRGTKAQVIQFANQFLGGDGV